MSSADIFRLDGWPSSRRADSLPTQTAVAKFAPSSAIPLQPMNAISLRVEAHIVDLRSRFKVFLGVDCIEI